jgi:hypothetical protein
VGFIPEQDLIYIEKSILRFFKGNAMFGVVLQIFQLIPLKNQLILEY